MTGGLDVAVIQGGLSAEAEVSRSSARAVVAALVQAGHRVRLLELDRDLPGALGAAAPDVVFPVTHGALGEDGCLQGLLEVLGLPYVGSGVLASALSMSKPDAKVLFRAAGLPVAPECRVDPAEDPAQAAARVRAALGPAVVVKPASGGSGIGVTRVAAADDAAVLERALVSVLQYDAALVERFEVGEEVTCGVLEDGDRVAALPPTLIRARAAAWYDFTSRYAPGGSEHVCPAPFPPALLTRIQEVAVAAHRALGCRDLSRVDFVVGDVEGAGTITLLEVNALPGMTGTSLFPEAAAAIGIEFAALCDALVRRAAGRRRRPLPGALALPG